MGWFKNIFANRKEDVAKADSSDNRGVISSHTPTKAISSNDAHAKGAAEGNTPTKETSKQPTATKPTTDQDDNREVVILPGIDAFWKAEQAWDKNRKAEAVPLFEQAIAEGYNNGDEPFYYLGCYYMDHKDWKNLKRIIVISPDYVLRQRWAVQAQQLLDVHLPILPNDWKPANDGKTANGETGETWKEQYERMIFSFPRFDFDMGDAESKIRDSDVKALNAFTLSIKRKLIAAQDHINKGKKKAAATILVEFVRNGYWKTEPYDMLMKLYHDVDQTDDEKRLAAHAVKHFSLIKEEQRRRVLADASLVDCVDFARDTMAKGKPIYYFDGLFEVYNSYPEIEKWQKLIDG